MKICWDNLEKMKYIGNGKWKKGSKIYFEGDAFCEVCNEEFFARNDRNNKFCSAKCCNNGKQYRHSEETRNKISKSNKGKKLSPEHVDKLKQRTGKNNPFYGKKHSDETKEKIRAGNLGEKNPQYGKTTSNKQKEKVSKENSALWKGGFFSRNVYSYDQAYELLYRMDEIRRNEEDPEVLETKCTYCGKWFIPTHGDVQCRISSLKEEKDLRKFYCSAECKEACPIFGLRIESIENKIYGIIKDYSREVQPELRKLVLERDNWTCQKCFKNKCVELHCHHIYPIAIEPLESADINNCITYCKDCHKEAHKKDGCKYGQLRECNN